jgi:Glycosyl transferases group 1
MKHSPHCLLSINNYFYPRGGAEVVFLEQNRMLEGAGWQGVLRAIITRPDILHIHSVGPALFTPLGRCFGQGVVVAHHLANYEMGFNRGSDSAARRARRNAVYQRTQSSPSLATAITGANMLAASLKQRRKHQVSSWLGYQSSEALAELYTHAGVFVLPSSHEGQPIAALEAISYRCPVILTDNPAYREIGTSATQFVRSATSRARRTSRGDSRRWRRAHARPEGT